MSEISRNLSPRFPSHSPSQHETRGDKIFFYTNLYVSFFLGKEEKFFEREVEKPFSSPCKRFSFSPALFSPVLVSLTKNEAFYSQISAITF